MIEETVLVKGLHGLHARPAARFVQGARQFQCELKVTKADRSANAKSLVSILALGVNQGSTIKIIADGPDEEEALRFLKALIEAAADDEGERGYAAGYSE